MVLLYIDMLGVKARWRSGGRPAAEEAFRALERFVAFGLSCIPADARNRVRGGVQSDAVALVFDSPDEAVLVGCAVFQMAFAEPYHRTDPRYWLRGVLLPCDDDILWLPDEGLDSAPNIAVIRPSRSLLDAVAIEQTGFKGMRLIMHPEAMASKRRKRYQVWFVGGEDRQPFHVIRTMRDANYPSGALDVAFMDILWMIPHDMTWWPNQQRRISDRLRWAAGDPEELVQVAATWIVFRSERRHNDRD